MPTVPLWPRLHRSALYLSLGLLLMSGIVLFLGSYGSAAFVKASAG